MEVNTINKKQAKQDLKTCAKSVKDYVIALENDIVRKQHVIDKALAKIKEQDKQLTIPIVVKSFYCQNSDNGYKDTICKEQCTVCLWQEKEKQ